MIFQYVICTDSYTVLNLEIATSIPGQAMTGNDQPHRLYIGNGEEPDHSSSSDEEPQVRVASAAQLNDIVPLVRDENR